MTIPDSKELLDPGCHMWLVGFRGNFHRNQNHRLGIPSNGGFMQKGLFTPQKCPEQQLSGLGIKDKNLPGIIYTPPIKLT